jgi:hypothetical protein
MARPVYLVGCGKSKLSRPAAARHLYTGTLFRRSLGYAEARAQEDGGDVFILSARYGLLNPGQTVAPYDLALGSLPKRERAHWGERVVRQICDAYLIGRPSELWRLRFCILAGAAYADAVVAALEVSTQPYGALATPPVEQPLRGMGIGQRLAWLGSRLEETT